MIENYWCDGYPNQENEFSCNDSLANNSITQLNPQVLSSSENNIMSIMSWNIQGIGKKFELDEIRQLLKKHDLIFLYETMKLDTYEPHIDGFHYFHHQRSFMHPKARRPSGGIAVLIRDSLIDSKVVTIA